MLSRWRGLRDTTYDAGMTLVELVVGMTLLSIVGAMALNFFVGTSTQADRVTDQSQDGAAARAAINQIATALRVADTPTARPGFSTARFVLPTGQTQLSGSELVFFSNLTTASRSASSVRTPPTKVDIKLSNGVLTEYLYAPRSGSYALNSDSNNDGTLDTYDYIRNYPSVATTTTVLLSDVSNAAVFSYCSDTVDQSGTCTPATTTDSVALVQITLTVAPLHDNAAQTVQSAIAVTGEVS